MNLDERKVKIEHGKPCRCLIDGQAIYVHEPCYVVGHHVTKRRVNQLIHSLKKAKCP